MAGRGATDIGECHCAECGSTIPFEDSICPVCGADTDGSSGIEGEAMTVIKRYSNRMYAEMAAELLRENHILAFVYRGAFGVDGRRGGATLVVRSSDLARAQAAMEMLKF
jgi:hypothetical protein